MLYNLIERKNQGGKQLNRVSLPYRLDLLAWDSTNKLFESGKIPMSVKNKYAYICHYEPLDWIEEELNVNTDDQYYLT